MKKASSKQSRKKKKRTKKGAKHNGPFLTAQVETLQSTRELEDPKKQGTKPKNGKTSSSQKEEVGKRRNKKIVQRQKLSTPKNLKNKGKKTGGQVKNSKMSEKRRIRQQEVYRKEKTERAARRHGERKPQRALTKQSTTGEKKEVNR